MRDPIELPAPRKAVRGDQDPPKPDDKPGMGARPSGWVTRASDLEDYVITYASGGCSLGRAVAVLGSSTWCNVMCRNTYAVRWRVSLVLLPIYLPACR